MSCAQNLAAELAADEYDHVAFFRTALGPAAIPIPPVIACHRPCVFELSSESYSELKDIQTCAPIAHQLAVLGLYQ